MAAWSGRPAGRGGEYTLPPSDDPPPPLGRRFATGVMAPTRSAMTAAGAPVTSSCW